MPLTLDHVVIAVADLDAAIADYGALGFTVAPGGEHGGGITHNALVVFGDGSYLELIAFRRPDPDNRWWRVFDRAGEGFVDFALLPTDIVADQRAARARGLDLSSPVPGSRLRPDGQRLAWQIARSPGSDVPFLCGDVTPRALRVPEGPLRRHANGVTGIAEVAVAVDDPTRSRGRYAALLASETHDGAAYPRGDLADGPIQIGHVRVRLLSRAGDPGDTGDLAAALSARGEGPYSLALSGPAADFDRAKAHGARLSVAPAPPRG